MAIPTSTLSVLVQDNPGVLARVAGLLARRAFNIVSLTVGRTDRPAVSRMTIVVEADGAGLEQAQKQLHKLVEVLRVQPMEPHASIDRRLVLVKVAADERRRTGVLQIVDLFRAHVVDVQAETIVVEASGSPSKVDALVGSLAPYGVREVVSSGAVSIGRGPNALTEPSTQPSTQPSKEN